MLKKSLCLKLIPLASIKQFNSEIELGALVRQKLKPPPEHGLDISVTAEGRQMRWKNSPFRWPSSAPGALKSGHWPFLVDTSYSSLEDKGSGLHNSHDKDQQDKGDMECHHSVGGLRKEGRTCPSCVMVGQILCVANPFHGYKSETWLLSPTYVSLGSLDEI